jgi:hypothetical protein
MLATVSVAVISVPISETLSAAHSRARSPQRAAFLVIALSLLAN